MILNIFKTEVKWKSYFGKKYFKIIENIIFNSKKILKWKQVKKKLVYENDYKEVGVLGACISLNETELRFLRLYTNII